jgi:dipeptidyl-peptidase-4
MEAMLFEPPDFEPGRDSLWHQRMAQKGDLVFVVDNRSASGKGRVSACAAHRRLGQTELADLEDAVDWLVAQGSADPARIAISGWSYGGN